MEQEPKELPHDIHDRGYKLLLSFQQLFQYLIEGYVEGDWKARLDYSRCEKIDKTYILEGLDKQESDVLYKVPLIGTENDPKEILLYILIERQSTVDHSIAFRVLMYVMNIWNEIYKNADENLRRQKTWRLPPVFPIVLYNGNDTWTAARSLQEMVEHSNLFGNYIPNLQYHLIDIVHYDTNKLKALHNALSALFLLEQSQDHESFLQSIREANIILSQEKDTELWKAILQWIVFKLKSDFPQGNPEALKELQAAILHQPREECHTMLETIGRKIFEEGMQAGLEKGMQAGLEKGKRIIIKLLQTRFGSVPKKIEEKILGLTQEESLWMLVEKAGTAPTIKEFKDALASLEK